MNEKKIIIILVILTIIFTFLGGTFAYLNWQTSEEQRTNVVFTVEQEFWCAADGGGNITNDGVNIAPANCTNSTHAVKREIKVRPTITGGHTVLMDLWLNINDIGEGFSNSKNFRYALTTNPNSCTDGLVKAGDFYGKGTGDKVSLLNYITYNKTAEETYYLYVWLDKEETNPDTMFQSFDFTLGGVCTNAPEPDAYMVYTEEDTTLRLYKRDRDIELLSDNYDSINLENTNYTSAEQVPWYEYREEITKVVIEDEISPISTSYWFSGLVNVESIDVSKLNTSKVTRISHMFENAGYNVNNFEIIGLDYFNTSNVTHMDTVFFNVGYSAINWDIGDLSKWNTSNVTTMWGMFAYAGYSATTWNIGNLSKWNTSNVTTMWGMFWGAGCNATTLDIGNINTKTVLRDNVTAYTAWDVSQVVSMGLMFQGLGSTSRICSIGSLSKWDTSKVNDMSQMFLATCENSSSFDIGNLDNWDTSSVTSMKSMFLRTGKNATTFNIGNISKWDTSNVTDMDYMFENAGYMANNWTQNLSNWNVSKVTSYDNFNIGVESKVTAPVWVN